MSRLPVCARLPCRLVVLRGGQPQARGACNKWGLRQMGRGRGRGDRNQRIWIGGFGGESTHVLEMDENAKQRRGKQMK